MEIKNEQWIAFGLISQDKKSYRHAAELMGVAVQRVRDLIIDLRRKQPDLFCTETENKQLIKQFNCASRPVLEKYEALMDNKVKMIF